MKNLEGEREILKTHSVDQPEAEKHRFYKRKRPYQSKAGTKLVGSGKVEID